MLLIFTAEKLHNVQRYTSPCAERKNERKRERKRESERERERQTDRQREIAREDKK